MGKKLKGVIFSINNVLSHRSNSNSTYLSEIKQLIRFLRARDIKVAVLANRDNPSLERELTNSVGQFPWFIVFRDRFAKTKQTKQATAYVLSQLGLDDTEVVYVGNTDDDMRTARNGCLLFLNAVWYGKNTEYGIEFDEPWNVARFIDIFCLREATWGYSIHDGDFEYYALAPFSTFNPVYKMYSEDAKSSAKTGVGNIDFWTKYLWSTIYFSELYKRINFVAPYPGHKANVVSTASNIIEEPMLAFTKCFGIEYLRDLIIRHKDATKSQLARQQGCSPDHLNQLNSIHLNSCPSKGSGQRFRNTPLNCEKTVLIVDDFCTEGHSLDSARVLIKKAQAKAICLSWLKTINTDYKRIRSLTPREFDPHHPNEFEYVSFTSYEYRRYLDSAHISVSGEIETRLKNYNSWYKDNWY